MSLVLIPGSFDPMTRGHAEMIRKAAGIFDEVVVGVMGQSTKKSIFSLEKRVEIAKISCAGIHNVRVVSWDGMTADLYRSLGADCMLRGIRNGEDLTFEKEILSYHEKNNKDLVTLFWVSGAELADISSTAVRQRIREGKDFDGLVAPGAAELIRKA